MLSKIIYNFYLRNLSILIIYVSPDIFQKIAVNPQISITELSDIFMNKTAFYIFFIFHSRILYEHLLLKKRYFIYALTFLCALFIWREGTSYIFWLLTKTSEETTYHIKELQKYNWILWVFIYWANIIYIYIGLGVYIAFKSIKDKERLLKIENEKKSLELKQLNEQLNPHFLFNALNNIYSYLLEDRNEGEELILKLSELMRYVISSSEKEKVPISEEVEFVDNYLAFEKERLGDRLNIDYKKQINSSKPQIMPLVIFNFVENAIKHGVTKIHTSYIYIDLKVHENSLYLFVSNPIQNDNIISTELGIKNTSRRLDILYQKKHSLNININENTYTVLLIINDL